MVICEIVAKEIATIREIADKTNNNDSQNRREK